MLRAYRFLKGYRCYRATGVHPEKFLNLCLSHRLYLWNIRRPDCSTLLFCVSNRGAELLKEFAEKTGTTLSVQEGKGLPVLLKTMKKRTVFLVSAACFLIGIFVASSFIWTVTFDAHGGIDTGKIRNFLNENGLGVGKIRKTVDTTYLSNQMINRFPEILWANVELSGTNLSVTLIPRTDSPPIVPKDVPANIVAKKDGYIKEITAENGEALVRAGDTVVKDQVLISGLIPSPSVGTRYIHSRGSVRAVTWEEKTYEKKLYEYVKVPTGNEEKHRELQLSFLKIPLDFRQSIDFYNYDSIIKEKHFLFVTYRETVFSEYTLKKQERTEEDAVKEATDRFLQELSGQGIEDLISLKTQSEPLSSDCILVTVFAECEEEIGISRSIPKPTDEE